MNLFYQFLCKYLNLHKTDVGLLSEQYIRPKLDGVQYTQHECQCCGKLFEHEYDVYFL